ncbi:hypothetical protein B0T18DRAFT_86235 [Schizothecium vesticola]|uniref:Uncharacterized protein n=1 Tax=Schizothecium vesticola TaxID=314040 RepID=A0AA40KB05_9PEZI|nr:hypothetical protein B0T18DRAFT_86235 [Schizothecium vesticola]
MEPPGPLFHPRVFSSFWLTNETTTTRSQCTLPWTTIQVRARRHPPPHPHASSRLVRLDRQPRPRVISTSLPPFLSFCVLPLHTSPQYQHHIHTKPFKPFPTSTPSTPTHPSSPPQQTSPRLILNKHHLNSPTPTPTRPPPPPQTTIMSSRSSYSTSMSPSPPSDIGSYSRYMAQHTKRQMEAASTSSPRRSSQASSNSAGGGGPSAMPNGVSSSRGQHSTSRDFGHQS